jgi:hypothetical protein
MSDQFHQISLLIDCLWRYFFDQDLVLFPQKISSHSLLYSWAAAYIPESSSLFDAVKTLNSSVKALYFGVV